MVPVRHEPGPDHEAVEPLLLLPAGAGEEVERLVLVALHHEDVLAAVEGRDARDDGVRLVRDPLFQLLVGVVQRVVVQYVLK